MQFFDQAAVARALPYAELADALAHGLQEAIESPLRSHFEPNHDSSTVLIMPAWKPQQLMGVKLVSIWPGNSALGRSAVSGVYVLISCTDGQAVAVLDGTELTLRRTAAATALAARILARKSSRTLAILGTGSLSAPLALAHSSVMDFQRVLVWGRSLPKAQAVVDALALQGLAVQASDDLQDTLAQADVVAAASTATDPFIRSAWVRPGTHLGLIGAFTPTMAEAEPALMPRAQVFADSREAIGQKGGEVLQAIQQGLIQSADILAELAELAAQPLRAWRSSDDAITVFKSVGFASLDLIAAERVWASRAGPGATP
ncbi:ornithine cyclodeaminase family protein [Rhodoferax lacus]|uniref:Ornithine cyclodeaminase family protein n=1 Tax=Rhodoferax lacus TaxID=2184758 RepID=A0A3E1RBH5_9BURK|nr:ornithine cyclodeaminase family protein [Rhodoferax lacus]RFO96699.1 ornithine cyclodeaminase family protein [Rhodoferax lacus]